jgi:hypothetical protein
MNEIMPVVVLLSEIEKGLAVLQRIDDFYRRFLDKHKGDQLHSTENAVVIADTLANYYTCLETVLLRISQYFENTLAREKWHQDLLDKMTLELQGVRERVISEPTARLLGELLRFRHFKRYYFEFDYDWDRLEYIQKKYEQLQPLLKADLALFVAFLRRLAAA